MDANEFFKTKVKKAKDFGFPEPISLNAGQLTDRTRVVFLAEIQATHIPDREKQKTHHYSLKVSKFKKIKEEPYWDEIDLIAEGSFSISERSSIEKLINYLKINEALLGVDILSKDFTSAILTNDASSIDLIKRILSNQQTKDTIYQLFKDQYPELDKKILTYKLVQARKKSLKEFKISLSDTAKKERNYWQLFLENNRWMFGLSYIIQISDGRIDLENTADYLFKSEDGFIDIIEIKYPNIDFWQTDSKGVYKKYRGFLVPSEELKGAITQATNYIFQVEKKFSDPDWQKKNGCETPVKPTCTVIYGRSDKWSADEKTAFRLLNDSLHGINIITFDHLYDRASRLLQNLEHET